LFANIERLIVKYGMNFVEGLGTTLLLAFISVLICCLIGAIVAIMRLSKSKILNGISAVYTEVIRDTPLLLQLYFFYFLLPDILPALELSKFTCIAVALIINSGAYMSEIIRAGIQSIDPGQMEAARSLGLTYWRSMYRVVLPQAIKNMVPSIVNQFIITLKDTSILSIIGFPELVNKAQNVIAITFQSFQVWTIVGLMYLVVILILQRIAKILERRLNYDRRAEAKQK